MACTEFTDAQIERIGEVENAVFTLCMVLTEQNLEWDMSYIGEIADVTADILVAHGFRVRYPASVEEPNGEKHITDYHS